MALKQDVAISRPKDHNLGIAPLNIYIIDCESTDLKSIIDKDSFTIYHGLLDDSYVSRIIVKKFWVTKLTANIFDF